MRKLIMWNTVTLEGHRNGAGPWSLGRHEAGWGEELERYWIQQLENADLILFGRVTYQALASWWSTADGEVADLMTRIPKIVFSRTLGPAVWNNTRVVNRDAESVVVDLKRSPGKDLLIIGSGDLCASLMRGDLIDEYRLGVAPIVLGTGRPLFKPGVRVPDVHLLEAKPLRTGGLIVRYAPVRVDFAGSRSTRSTPNFNPGGTMQFHAYLNFDGRCAEAMRSYADLLGGELEIMTFAESPAAEHAPEGWGDRVIHAALKVGDQMLMASDAPSEQYRPAGGTYVSVSVDTVDEARRIFDGLAKGAEIEMPFGATFWSPGFGSLVDRWGTPWMVGCAAPADQASSPATAEAATQ